MSDNPEEEKGYCKPPKAYQFKKGQTGNSEGARKHRPDFSDLLFKALSETMIDFQNRRMSMLEAIAIAGGYQAIRGNMAAWGLIAAELRRGRPTQETAADQTAQDLQLLSEYRKFITPPAGGKR